MSPLFFHDSVMTAEVMQWLSPHSGGYYADLTLGGGGHAAAILDAASPEGRVLGIDRDLAALNAAQLRLSAFGDRARLVHARFSALSDCLRNNLAIQRVDGLVADLGVSSPQLDQAERGFSFQHNGPLDMRMDTSSGETARQLLARLPEAELADVIYEFGEERKSRRIARAIKRAVHDGGLETTDELRRVVSAACGGRSGRTDPSTRTFMALRIAVNTELDELGKLLRQLPDVLRPGGVAVLISFHSLEDRLVKRAFRDEHRLEVLTKKPVCAGLDEVERNPRARSAKLRAARFRVEESIQ